MKALNFDPKYKVASEAYRMSRGRCAFERLANNEMQRTKDLPSLK